MNQTLQDRVATRPADAIQYDVALTDCSDETIRCKPWQENTVISGVEAGSFERALEPGSKHLGDAPTPSEFDKGKLTVGYLGRDACEHSVKLRQIFWQGLTAPIDDGACAQTQLCAVNPGKRSVGRFVIDRKIRQPNELFGIVIRSACGFHEIAADEVIDGRKSTGDGVSPGTALNCREPLGRQLRRQLVHPDFGKNQNMRRVVQYRAPPGIERQRALYETVAQCRRCVGLAIPFGARVIAGHMKPIPVQHFEPSLDRNLPIRVLPEEAAYDTQPDRLVRARRVWQNGRRVSRSHDFADERPIQGLKLLIVAALIREIKRLMGADRLCENSGCVSAFYIRAQAGQPARIGVAPFDDF